MIDLHTFQNSSGFLNFYFRDKNRYDPNAKYVVRSLIVYDKGNIWKFSKFFNLFIGNKITLGSSCNSVAFIASDFIAELEKKNKPKYDKEKIYYITHKYDALEHSTVWTKKLKGRACDLYIPKSYLDIEFLEDQETVRPFSIFKRKVYLVKYKNHKFLADTVNKSFDRGDNLKFKKSFDNLFKDRYYGDDEWWTDEWKDQKIKQMSKFLDTYKNFSFNGQ